MRTVSGFVKIARGMTMILMGAARCFVIHAISLRINLITVEGRRVQEEQEQFDGLNGIWDQIFVIDIIVLFVSLTFTYMRSTINKNL